LNMFVDQILRLLPSLIKMEFAVHKVSIYPKVLSQMVCNSQTVLAAK